MGLFSKLKEQPRPFSHNRNNTFSSVGEFLLTTSNSSYSSTDLHTTKQPVDPVNKVPLALQPAPDVTPLAQLLPDSRGTFRTSPQPSPYRGTSPQASPQSRRGPAHQAQLPYNAVNLHFQLGTQLPAELLEPHLPQAQKQVPPNQGPVPVPVSVPVPQVSQVPVPSPAEPHYVQSPAYIPAVVEAPLTSASDSVDSNEVSATGSDDSDNSDEDATSEIASDSGSGSEYESESEPDLAQENGIPRDHPYYEQWQQYYAQLAQRQSQTYPAMGGYANPMMNPQILQLNQMNPMNPMNPMNSQMYQFMNQMQMNPQMNQMQMNPQMQMQFSYFMQQFMMQQPQMMQMMQQPQEPMAAPRPPYSYSGSLSPRVPHSRLMLLLQSSSKKRNSIASMKPDTDSTLLRNSRMSSIKSNRYPSVPLSLHQSALIAGDPKNRVSSLDLNFKPKEFTPYKDENDALAEETEDSSDPGNEQLKRYISDYSKYLFDEDKENAKDLSPPKIERKESNASTNSYNSIQSGASSKFRVGSISDRSTKIAKDLSNMHIASMENEKKHKKKHSNDNRRKRELIVDQTRSSNPNLSDIMTPPMKPTSIPPSGNNSPISPMQTMGQYPMPDYPYADYDRRHTVPDFTRMSMMMPPMPSMPPMGTMNPGNRMSMVPSTPGRRREMLPKVKSGDETIHKKIEEFIELRQLIASGKKSSEFRVKWVKMLIRATNYRVYAYINIKGDPVLADQVSYNKKQFIKSSITHLEKLVKEFENKHKMEDLESEVYYIQGCLLMGDYHYTYGQDYNMKKDISRALESFEKSLSQNANNFKTLYKLGELYEREFPDRFDTAVNYFKSSAKLGYNRAIYKMAMLYLEVPDLRSVKFFKWLRQLADIDLESKDINLTAEDRDELEEVVGMASYQVGKVYEGIYPGDLTEDDPFVVQSLERAPISYNKSLMFYNRSAKLNCILAQVKLGTVYENGDLGRQVNPHKSVQWYMLAASSPLSFRRHQDAMLGLSRWCLHGTDGLSKHIPSPNPDKAVWWCEQALDEFQLADAYFFMGHLCDIGLTGRDPRVFYKRALDLGHPMAASMLQQEQEP